MLFITKGGAQFFIYVFFLDKLFLLMVVEKPRIQHFNFKHVCFWRGGSNSPPSLIFTLESKMVQGIVWVCGETPEYPSFSRTAICFGENARVGLGATLRILCHALSRSH